MASRVAVVFTIVLALFVLSSFQAQARVQLQEPENLATEWNPSNNLPDSDSDAKSTISILLPTDRIQSYSEEIPDDRAVETEPKDLPESDADSTTVRSMRPFKVSYDDGFRPINHHFHHMPLKHHQPFHFRFPIRCRHHQQLGKPMGRGRGRGMGMGPRFTYGREISYGNDMIMSEEAKFDPMPRFQQGEMRRIPGMMIPRRPVGDNNGFREEDQMERHHHHHRHHHEEEHEHEREHQHEHEEREEREEKEGREEEGGFMFLRNFRKFLTDMKP